MSYVEEGKGPAARKRYAFARFDTSAVFFSFKLKKNTMERGGGIIVWFGERRASKAVICHLDTRNSAATRAFSDVRRTTEIKPVLAGLIVK